MKRLLLYFALTYALTWACFIAVAARPMSQLLVQVLILLGAFEPAIVAVSLTALAQGEPGVRGLVTPVLRWRVSWLYYVFALFFIAAVKLAVAVLIRSSTGGWPAFGKDPLPVMLAATLFSTPFQAGEEIGWRGFALPQLAERFGLGPASLLLGAIWACWHLPQFYIRQADTRHQSFPLYFLQVVALSVAIAWLWGRTRHSLLLPMVFHAATNNLKDIVPSASLQPGGVFTFHASLVGWLTLALLWCAAAVFLATMPRNTTDNSRGGPSPYSTAGRPAFLTRHFAVKQSIAQDRRSNFSPSKLNRMQAMVLEQYGKLDLRDMPQPVPGPGEVLIRVAACGICGSDVHGYDGSSGRRIPPIVMGHEAAGTVAAVGEGVAKLRAGDRVTMDSTIYCGACPYCRRGEINLCDRREVLGVSCGEYRRDGAYAEYVTVPERIVHRLPESMSFVEAAMLEPTSVALHAVAVSQLRGAETAVVIGAGMIGLLTMQAARAAGAARVLIADVDATRLRLAERLGATETLHIAGSDLVKQVLQRVPGGVDVALEAVGRQETITAAIHAVRKGGTVTLIGNISPEVTIPLQVVVGRQLRLQGTAASSGEYPQAIEMISKGEIKVKPLITAVAPLTDGPRWFERLYAHEPNLMKIVLAPDPEAVR